MVCNSNHIFVSENAVSSNQLWTRFSPRDHSLCRVYSMAHHLEQIQHIVKQPQEQLLKDFVKCADGIRIIGPHIWDVREKTLLDSEDNATVFRRVYIKVHDSGDLRNIGWIMDDSSEQCFLCASHFSSVTWKHHCRRCGLTVCAPCSAHRVLLKGFENQGVQRVCNNCSPGVC